jgi:hypothetical protein
LTAWRQTDPVFIDNKYHRWYDELMAKAAARGPIKDYTEKHHIIPKSINNDHRQSNLVRLTFREHFLAHWLLTKFTCGWALTKMRRAMSQMCHARIQPQRIVTSWQFAKAKTIVRGMGLTDEHKRRLGVAMRGKVLSLEHRRKLSESHKGYIPTAEQRRKISLAHKGKKQRKRTPEECQKNREMQLSLPRIRCVHCGGKYSPAMFTRWHDEQCWAAIRGAA